MATSPMQQSGANPQNNTQGAPSAGSPLPKLESHADLRIKARDKAVKRAPTEKSLVNGQELFREGDFSREVFLIKEGEVAVLKGEGTNQVELTRLGKGSVIGEMALLDNQPRSATIKATQKTIVTIISEQIFVSVLKTLPTWLIAILKVISNRLRNANQQLAGSTTNDVEKSLAFYLHQKSEEAAIGIDSESNNGVEYFHSLDEFMFQTHCSKNAFNDALAKLAKRKLIQLSMDKNSSRIIRIPERLLLDLFCEYRNALAKDGKYPAANFSQAHKALLHFILKLSEEHGPKLPVLIYSQKEFYADLDEKHPGISTLEIKALKDMGIIQDEGAEDFALDIRFAKRLQVFLDNMENLVGGQG